METKFIKGFNKELNKDYYYIVEGDNLVVRKAMLEGMSDEDICKLADKIREVQDYENHVKKPRKVKEKPQEDIPIEVTNPPKGVGGGYGNGFPTFSPENVQGFWNDKYPWQDSPSMKGHLEGCYGNNSPEEAKKSKKWVGWLIVVIALIVLLVIGNWSDIMRLVGG